MIHKRSLALGLGLAGIVILLDQATKAWMMGLLLEPPRALGLTGFFTLVPVWNRGVSFGILSTQGGSTAWLLGGVALVVAAVLVGWLSRVERALLALSLGLVIGGALGNLLDRLIYTRVADFFHFYVRGFDWYVFNIADCAIALGVGALLYDAMLRPEPEAGETNG